SSHQIWSPVTGSYAARSPPPSPTGVRAAPMPLAPCPPPSTKGATKVACHHWPVTRRSSHLLPRRQCPGPQPAPKRTTVRPRQPIEGQPGNIGATEDSLVAIEARVGGQEPVLRPFD